MGEVTCAAIDALRKHQEYRKVYGIDGDMLITQAFIRATELVLTPGLYEKLYKLYEEKRT